MRIYDRALSVQEINDAMERRTAHHRADTNQNGCIEGGEITSFINMWYADSTVVSMIELVRALEVWKGGGC